MKKITIAMIKAFEKAHPIKLNAKKIETIPEIQKMYEQYGSKYMIISGVDLTLSEMQILFDNRAPNRNLDPVKILGMIEDVRQGKWFVATGNSLCFGNKRNCVDGQNRLAFSILAEMPLQTFAIAINVDEEFIQTRCDSGKKRGVIDRTVMRVRNDPNNPIDKPHPLLNRMINYATILSPIGRKLNNNKMSVGYDVIDFNIKNPIRCHSLRKTCGLYDELNIDKKIKKIDVYWACIYRAYHHFERENRVKDLENYILMTFNSKANTVCPYDGWAKMAKEQNDIDCRSRKGNGTIKNLAYNTQNKYLRNFFDKIPCPIDVRSRKITVKQECFVFPDEIERIERIEQEMLQEKIPNKNLDVVMA